jgi:protein-tyrosine phosphatase
MSSYVDLHAHFLAGLDDGAETLDESLEMIRGLGALGFGHLHATPHQRAGMFMPSRERIDAALDAARAAVAAAGAAITLGLAAENYWDDVLHERLAANSQPTYDDDGRAFLFELNPQMMPPLLEAALFRVRLKGQLPVLAHPERYRTIQENPNHAETLARSAALLVDVAALEGAHGRAQMKAARTLVASGVAHAVTSDLHEPADLPAVAAGMTWIRKNLGATALDRLLAENPRRILAGELP